MRETESTCTTKQFQQKKKIKTTKQSELDMMPLHKPSKQHYSLSSKGLKRNQI